MRSSQRHLCLAAKGLLTLACLCLAAACSLETPLVGASREISPGRSEWLILLFMSADNELSPYALDDLNELESIDLEGTGITVVDLVDGPAGESVLLEIAHDPNGLDPRIVSRSLRCDELSLPGDAGHGGELNTGDPAVLATTLSWLDQRYRPANTALVVWGHGSGYYAHGFDDTHADPLTTTELGTALDGAGVEVVAFDTSMGATVEVAYELSGRAGLMIASQAIVPLTGWDYRLFLEALLASAGSRPLSPGEVADAALIAYRQAHGSEPGACLSVVDLRRVSDAVAGVNALAAAMVEALDSGVSGEAIRHALFYDTLGFFATPGDLSIDLRDMARVLGDLLAPVRLQAATLREAIDRAVIASTVAGDESNPGAPPGGISIHLIPLLSDGTSAPSHHESYQRRTDTDTPALRFVRDSFWVPVIPQGSGLLHRLFYPSP
ncbi:MAG: hypothetical protein E4H09_03370 [Spirochaetales bacterium]|nr:MAG: hypothetical protein E4H09_03370 [Spirochaetales bacterium]